MKSLIIAVNIVIAALIAVAAAPLFKPVPVEKSALPVKAKVKTKGKTKGKSRSEAARKNAQAEKETPPTREEVKSSIIDSDIFNPERTPNAAIGRRNVRVELALVGTIEAGKYRAAVIVQRTNTRQINPFMRMMWGGPGGPGGMGPGGPGGMGPGGRGGRRFGMGLNNLNNQQRRNNPAMVKQYVRVGETMPNGYKLTTLTRTRAVLTRGGDKMELELQVPSRNQNAARRTTQRLNVNQQLQQAQLQTQQMMVRALMEMRNSGGAGRGPGGGNRGGGNRGGRR